MKRWGSNKENILQVLRYGQLFGPSDYEELNNLYKKYVKGKGNCYDNSPMENFFGLMKQEMYYGQVYNSFDDLKEAIDKYIRYYNQKRSKASLGYRSPVEYREEMLAA